jgi:hypothetical protein
VRPALAVALLTVATPTVATLSNGTAEESPQAPSGERGPPFASAGSAEDAGLVGEGARARSARSEVGGWKGWGGPKAGAPPEPARTAAAGDPETPSAADPDPQYDGRFTFLRIQYGESGTSGLRGFRRGREPPWAHDTPRAERNFAKILTEVSYVKAYMDGGRVVTFDDPALFQYPIAYIVEVGFWRPTDEEAEALRAFLLKGGFLIVDDFRGRDIWNFEEQMQRVLPGSRLIELDGTHGIFDSFFHIPDPLAMVPAYGNEPPLYLGIFEENDPDGRLMAIVNYNNDLAEYWEFSDVGFYPIDLSNEAYKFGVNYIIYAMTH